jgi:hypothetical protein
LLITLVINYWIFKQLEQGKKRTVGQGVDLGGLAVDLDLANTGEGVGTANVHGARTANTLTAGATEGKGGVDLVLDLDQGIKDHGAAVVHVDLI